MDTNRETFIIDKDRSDRSLIRRRVILNPEFYYLLSMWRDLGCPECWKTIDTYGGAYSHPFDLSEEELKILGVEYEPSTATYWATQYYFSDLAKSFL